MASYNPVLCSDDFEALNATLLASGFEIAAALILSVPQSTISGWALYTNWGI
jgi:hypothetical protein